MSARSTTGYAALLRIPGVRGFSAAGFVGRLPIAMVNIGTVLLVQDRRGSYALAGLVTAASPLGSALMSPQVSRLVDRYGQGRVLPLQLAASMAGLVALVLLAGTTAPAVLLVAAAALSGGMFPQVGSCVRARWNAVLTRTGRDAEVPQAYAWESVVDEVVFVVGPLLVVACAALDPALGLLVAALLASAGTLTFAAQGSTQPPVHLTAVGSRSALTFAGMPALVLSSACVGAVFGSIEVAMVAFAGDRGAASAAGWLLALLAVGSAVSGLVYGARHWPSPLPRRYLLALLMLAVGCVPLLLAPSVPLMAPAALLAGLAISPTIIASFGLVDQLVPPAGRTEGFTWVTSGIGLGMAAGSAAAGVLADGPGARVAFAVSVAGGLGAAVVALRAGADDGAQVAGLAGPVTGSPVAPRV